MLLLRALQKDDNWYSHVANPNPNPNPNRGMVLHKYQLDTDDTP